MKHLYRLFVIALAGASFLLAGCAPGPWLKTTSSVLNMGLDLPTEMVKVNLIGTIGYDETFSGNYSRPSRNILYTGGIEAGKPEFGYRVVRVNLRHISAYPGFRAGDLGYSTAAMVPDNFPLLKAWDIIEIRHTGGFYTMKDFAKTGEGNAIIRVLCQKSQPDYEECADALPKLSKNRAQGYTGTPYLPSLKDYGYSFSTRYGTDGTLLSPFLN